MKTKHGFYAGLVMVAGLSMGMAHAATSINTRDLSGPFLAANYAALPATGFKDFYASSKSLAAAKKSTVISFVSNLAPAAGKDTPKRVMAFGQKDGSSNKVKGTGYEYAKAQASSDNVAARVTT